MKTERSSSLPRELHRLRQHLSSLHRGIYNAGLAVERFRSRLSLKQVERGGKPSFYLERPGPGEKLVLVHGFTGSKDNWLMYAQHLPRDLHLIVPDLIGHGENAPDMDRSYHGWAFTDALHDLLGEIGLERFHLAGHSLGGLLSTGYATRHPEQVQSLLLVCPAGVHPNELSDSFRLIEEGRNPFLCDSRSDYDRYVDLLFHIPAPIPGLAHSFLCRDLLDRKLLFARMWEDLNAGDEDITALLRSVDTPTRVVWGRHDRVLHPAGMEIFRDNIPSADGAWLECGHCPPVECPGELAALHLELVGHKMKG